MARRRRKQHRKWVSRIVFLLLFVVALVVCYFVWDGYFREKEVPKVENDNVTVAVKKEEEGIDDVVEQPEEIEKEEIKQYEGDNPNEKNELTGVMTYAGVSGEYLVIRVNIDQYLSSGRCDLTLARNNETLFSDVTVISDSASTSTCEGFNVPVNQLGNGNIQIIINLNSDGKSGVITGEVVL